MRKQRVLVVTPDFPPERGGIQVLVHRVVSSWSRVEPVVVTLGAPRAAAFDGQQPFPVHRLRAAAAPRRARIALLNALVVKIALDVRPAAVLSGHIVTSPGAATAARLLGVPFLEYLHGQEVVSRPGLASFAVKRATRSIAVSRFTAGLAHDRGAHASRIVRIHPGVDLPDASTLPDETSSRIAVVARLDEAYKGHDVLLRALPLVRAQVPDAQLVVIGDGALRPVYEALAASFGVEDAVTFVGGVDDAERDAILATSAVFAMPSRVAASGAGEGFGIVYLEAGARGLPVIAGNRGGAVDAVVDGETGVLVDADDHLAVADALTALLGDRSRARALGDAGARRAQGFAWPLVSQQVEETILATIGAAA